MQYFPQGSRKDLSIMKKVFTQFSDSLSLEKRIFLISQKSLALTSLSIALKKQTPFKITLAKTLGSDIDFNEVNFFVQLHMYVDFQASNLY